LDVFSLLVCLDATHPLPRGQAARSTHCDAINRKDVGGLSLPHSGKTAVVFGFRSISTFRPTHGFF